jgi:hypothetical protein
LIPGAIVLFLQHHPLDDLFELQVGDQLLRVGSEALAGLQGELVSESPAPSEASTGQ